VILKVTVSPCAAVPSSCTSTVNVNVSPGAPDPGPLTTSMVYVGGEVTVAVPVTDLPLLVAVIMYGPEALSPSTTVVCACPLLPVVGFGVPSVTLPSVGLTEKVTPCPGAAAPFSSTSTTKVNQQ
jgi:hypothetical protein